MANHEKRSANADAGRTEPPEIVWLSIVESKEGFHPAAMVTKGDKILKRELGKPEPAKRYALDVFRMWVMDRLGGWTA